ncbi:unnamed protein product [Nippostrongylus brasiliensis]|uniref:DUF3995 domain-containing protein n=1 Tax=Nippostrongylus brasiliensis TaxID=27835 RepID=A0A0N4XZ97_NIPBR|nr:unnamed protein product [Nippostrongylus brasiliensis]
MLASCLSTCGTSVLKARFRTGSAPYRFRRLIRGSVHLGIGRFSSVYDCPMTPYGSLVVAPVVVVLVTLDGPT